MSLHGTTRVFSWDWSRSPTTAEEVNNKHQLEALLQQVTIGDTQDAWVWNDGKEEGFSVAAVKKWLRGSETGDVRSGFTWSKWVPMKCNIFMWRAFLDRLPTKMALIRRNIMVDNHLCVWCESNEETVEHILTGCSISAGIWNGISRWCRIPGMFVFHVNDLVKMHEHCAMSGNKKMVIHGIIIIACWRLWTARNEKVFSSKDPNVVEMLTDIKTVGFLWYKHRFKGGVVDWDRWCSFELM
ncbi:uncharacterized protein LOC118481001 [Helianthus annuus]|uniref:uncharacterized protein LOC118481001 n=1 Tax=Helianthus annuus TaxID=4232 RepID=UPI0016534148|nr:uncharacterized protein LOC118481001 [Helianthus annuus]